MSGFLMIWGLVVHLICDWPLQNDWIATNKANLRHPAGYVHAGIHGAAQLLVFPWWAALAIAVTHLLIDTRRPVVWWSQLVGQTQPRGKGYDIGLEVRFWTDQVFHIAVIAALALVVA